MAKKKFKKDENWTPKDRYQQVTDQILAQLEAGVVPWIKPWKTLKSGEPALPTRSTGESYRGINIPILWASAMSKGFTSNRWISMDEARRRGGQVREAEWKRYTQVVYFKRLSIKETKDDGTERDVRVPLMKVYNVFNVEQCDGLPAPEPAPEPTWEPLEAAESTVRATGAVVVENAGDRACFIPSIDKIHMPSRGAFDAPEHFYATLLHELTHWTGHSTRLDRLKAGGFGSKVYCFEELVAEMGAAFLCAELGIEGRLQHADYIGSWIAAMKENNKVVVRAAGAAQKAVDYIMKREYQREENE